MFRAEKNTIENQNDFGELLFETCSLDLHKQSTIQELVH